MIIDCITRADEHKTKQNPKSRCMSFALLVSPRPADVSRLVPRVAASQVVAAFFVPGTHVSNVNDMSRHGVRDHRYHSAWSCEMAVCNVLLLDEVLIKDCILHFDGCLEQGFLHREREMPCSLWTVF